MNPSGSGGSPKGSEAEEHPHMMMSSTEVDLLVHSYLVESAFSLLHESTLGLTLSDPVRQAQREVLMRQTIPPGHMVRILQKGLLYLEAEAKYRGDPPEPAPRLIGYTIPNAMPLPPLPKEQREQANLPTPGPSTAERVKQPSLPPPTPSATAAAPSAKEKGKGKETVDNKKRKGRASLEKDDAAPKRPRTASAEVRNRRKKATTNSPGPGTEDDESRTDATPAENSPAPEPQAEVPDKARKRTASPVESKGQRSRSPSVAQSVTSKGAENASATSALANARLSPALPLAPKVNGKRSVTTSPTVSTVALPQEKAQETANETANESASEVVTNGVGSHDDDDSATTAKLAELLEVKAEEAESQALATLTPAADNDAEMKDAEPEETSDHLQIKSTDSNVTILRGHTVPKVQGISWNSKVPNLLATGGGDASCRIWDVTVPVNADSNTVITENILCKHSGQRKCDVAAVAWNPAGSLLATGSEDGIARVWTPAGDLHLVLSMHQRTIFSLKWNSAGTQILTGSLDGTVCLWDLNSGKVKQQWSTHADSVLDVDWNDDETFASASMDKSVHLFHVARMPPMHRFKGHRDEVNVVRFSPCQTLLASCSDDFSVRIWSLKGLVSTASADRIPNERLIDDGDHNGVLVLEGHEGDVHTVAWAPWKAEDDQPKLLASASFDFSVRLWDADTGECLHQFKRHTDFVYSISFGPTPEQRDVLATASNDGKLLIWRLSDRKLVQEFEHKGPLYELAWHPSGTALCVTGRTEDVAVVGYTVS